MSNTSEYTFPIFISSTDYNLKDLRAELARFLTELSYKPILSSFEGFPDYSPILEPWESCLPALDRCFVMVLIIDGNYGNELKWPNYKQYFNDDKFSPTHGEYIFAHKNKKRMLVFIRENLMPHYQSFRKVMKDCDSDIEKAKAILNQTLPDNISFETLNFINKVKTTRPIPWITEFKDITNVKREIQKKMLNELAELFLIKNKHSETVIEAFNIVMDTLSLEEQKNALSKINATKQIIDAVDKIESYQNDLEKVKLELENTLTTNTTQRKKYEKQIETFQSKIELLELKTLKSNNQFFIKDRKIKIGNPNYIDSFAMDTNTNYENSFGFLSSMNFDNLHWNTKKCDRCEKTENTVFVSNQNKSCPSCQRNLCSNCWEQKPKMFSSQYENLSSRLNNLDVCPECKAKKK